MANIKLGLTLYSLTKEQVNFGWTTEDCLKAAKQLGVTGVEFVASQTFGTHYPWPTDEELYNVANLCAKYGLEIAAYSGQADRGKRSDLLDLSEEDMLAYAINDVKNAYKIGAKAQRQQNNMYPEAFKKLAPWAEKYGVKVGIEMHNPMTPREPNSEAFNKAIEEADSPYIGWTPDFGMFGSSMMTGARPKNMSEADQKIAQQMARRRMGIPSRAGMPEEVCQFFEDHQDMSNEELEAAMAQFDLTDFQKGAIHVMLFNPDLAGDTRDTIWEDFESIIVPHTVHCHGKFTSLNEEGDDPNIHTSRVLDILKKSDYDGYISIEWEGRTDHPTMPVLQRHVDFYRKTLGIQG
ncbi:MAG: TIM barrel protein [Oscillospiraceae bacterium]|nr:TIM barrel protein [Oscillospiraceae bacterium]